VGLRRDNCLLGDSVDLISFSYYL